MKNTSGKLMLIGGTEDRSKNIEVFVQMLSFTDARKILIIPSAVPEHMSIHLGAEYNKVFKSISPSSNIEILDVKKPGDLNCDKNKKMIKQASLVFFTGGSQSRLAAIFRNSPLLDLLKSRFLQGQIDIAGTSAGASVMGETIIFSDQEVSTGEDSFACAPGFNLLSGFVIDSHVLERNRIFRLAKSLAINPGAKGIGLTEDAGIVVDASGMAEAFGENPTVYLAADETTTEEDKGGNFSMAGINLGLVSKGGIFDLKKWCLKQALKV